MSRGPSTFRQRDVTAAVKAVAAAGIAVTRIKIGKDGSIEISTGGDQVITPPELKDSTTDEDIVL